MDRHLALPLAAALACSALPAAASGQYRNDTVGLDMGYWRLSRPTATDRATGELAAGAVPLRLSDGLRLGGEAAFELRRRLWLTTRVSVGFLGFGRGDGSPGASLDARFDATARATLGTVVGVEGQAGLRFLAATGRVRPYLQGAVSFLWLSAPGAPAAAACREPCSASSNSATFLAHPSVGGVHVQPGLEVVVRRDTALHLFADVQRWLVLNGPDNVGLVLGAGVVFFT